MKELPLDLLKSLFHYDSSHGELYWKERPEPAFKCFRDYRRWNALYAGKKAGCISKSTGYRYVAYQGRKYEVHRLIWAIETGQWPDRIDHKEGRRDDNRFSELRSVSHSENMRNQAMPKSNTSGICGVYFSKQTRKWVAFITGRGRKISLGHFERKEDAAKARKDAELKYDFHPNHGRKCA
ncbi:HNH endonuclease [Rhizobiaceae bacterium CRRU44]|uniref:HNH endonuclease n=1 Tax=Ferranicluibacter rubi TaxID=2715133 RepID=A0AA43ZF49_9HYPH|nr:HNH endonuclease signature motif containing protein [Ferranicluibacter rubi]NHT75885.1 HNH endonuclease [Ferranicluibacter rubi]NHT75945.1 HNH endonuclease [Ferranicluibacter rubi]